MKPIIENSWNLTLLPLQPETSMSACKPNAFGVQDCVLKRTNPEGFDQPTLTHDSARTETEVLFYEI
jgi:hypothetical protein